MEESAVEPESYPLLEDEVRFYHIRWTKPSTGTPKESDNKPEKADSSKSEAELDKADSSQGEPEEGKPEKVVPGSQQILEQYMDQVREEFLKDEKRMSQEFIRKIMSSPQDTQLDKLTQFQGMFKGKEKQIGLTPAKLETLIRVTREEIERGQDLYIVSEQEDEEKERTKKKKKKKNTRQKAREHREEQIYLMQQRFPELEEDFVTYVFNEEQGNIQQAMKALRGLDTQRRYDMSIGVTKGIGWKVRRSEKTV